MKVTKVFRFGCRAPRQETLALQLLGQASNYASDVRRAHNEDRRKLSRRDEDAHVIAWARQPERRTERNARMREARSARGHLVDAGTYWLVEDAVNQSARATALGEPVRARPRVWDGTGRIGAAIQAVSKPVVAEAGGFVHSRVMLTAPNERRHAFLRINVGPLAEGRAIEWPVKVHRDLPPGAVVDRVAVQRIRNGWRYRWEALITVTYEERRERSPGIAAMRLVMHDDHVANVLLPDGEVIGVMVPVAGSLEYSDSVHSIRDDHFNSAKALAAERYTTEHEHPGDWRNKARLNRLAMRTGDADLEQWRYRDRHLEDIESGVRKRAGRRRLDAYRVLAASVAKHADVLAVEDMRPEADRVYAIGELHHVLSQRVALSWHEPGGDVTDLRDACERWIDEHGAPRARATKVPKKKGDRYVAPEEGAEHECEVADLSQTVAQAAE